MLEQYPRPYSDHKGATKRANATGSKVELIYQDKSLVPNELEETCDKSVFKTYPLYH